MKSSIVATNGRLVVVELANEVMPTAPALWSVAVESVVLSCGLVGSVPEARQTLPVKVVGEAPLIVSLSFSRSPAV